MIFFSIVSCKQEQTNLVNETSITVSPDSLINQWNSTWNQHDSTAVLDLFTEQSSVILSYNKKLKGLDSINALWLRSTLPVLLNLKTENFTSSSGAEFAYYSGNYSADDTRIESKNGKQYGCFTMIWKLHSDKTWKVELLFFGDLVE
jgi:ketosteroid isomerase-like protein